jgi:alpha-amylase
MATSDGLTISVYQGQEQHFSGLADPYDREAVWLSGYNTSAPLYKHVQSLNAIRSLALYESSDYLTWHTQVVYSDEHNIAFRKGDSSYMTLMVVNNLGEAAQNYNVSMPNVGFPAGLTVVDVLSCRVVVVDSSGALEAQFVEGLPMVSLVLPSSHSKLAAFSF